MTPKTQAVGDGAGNGTASATRPQPQAREAPLTNPTITQRAESIARIIDPQAFKSWEQLNEYCLRNGDGETSATETADWAHGQSKAAALAKANEILSLPPITDASASVGEGETARRLQRAMVFAADRQVAWQRACGIAFDASTLPPDDPRAAAYRAATFDMHNALPSLWIAIKAALATLSPAPQTTGGEGELSLAFRLERCAANFHLVAHSREAPSLMREALAALSASPPLEVVEALREMTTWLEELAEYQARPERGGWGVECSLCMGELIETAERELIERARSALSALQPDRFGLPGSASTADAATAKSAATEQVKP